MTFDLSKKLVVGVASSALFDLTESDRVFRERGPIAYEEFQDEHLADPLAPGAAYPFIQRLLSLNGLEDLAGDAPAIEVIVMSRNSATTGLRVMRSIQHHCLPISRAIFTAGKTPFEYCRLLNVSLFLTADAAAVRAALQLGLPAGQVLDSELVDDPDDPSLRIAFDFDGVLADDGSEQVFASSGLKQFVEHEVENADVPHNQGVMLPFLMGVARIQQAERSAVRDGQEGYSSRRLRVAVVTARNAPAHERAVNSLRHWGVEVDDTFFLGGIDKGAIVEVLRPHIFFDDQTTHLESTRRFAPSVHVPFGIRNQVAEDPAGGV